MRNVCASVSLFVAHISIFVIATALERNNLSAVDEHELY